MKLLARFLLALLGAALGLALAEGVVRVIFPDADFEAAGELKNFRENPGDLTQRFVVDPEFGFRPILGTREYDAHGIRRNLYGEQKRAGTTRLLFIGDSVTARGKIVAGLRRCYGDERFEYLNAGVESFNTIQEARFLEKYNLGVAPDHVILTFHVNDFQLTPAAFVNSAGKLAVYTFGNPTRSVNRWLFARCHLYRTVVRLLLLKPDAGARMDHVVQEVRAALERLKRLATEHDFRLTVLLHPSLLPQASWPAVELEALAAARALLAELELRWFDLSPLVEQALAQGTPLADLQENPGDPWHPSDKLAALFAFHLFREGIFSSP